MLSDKEKEAIELLEDYLICGNKEGVLCRNLRIISTIIEKQQKEIERLEARKYMLNAETGEISQIPIDNNYISKDKIKAKIEEIDIEIQCCEYADDDTEEYKQDIEKEKRRLLRDKAVLQSLLEKE